jgi:error-prone DNA polymerase
MHYAELATTTNYSFLRGASPPRDLVLTALALGHSGLGIADRNSVAGVVRAFSALEELRKEGAMPAEKVREGSGPGEFAWRETSLPLLGDDKSAADLLTQRALSFKLATGARLAFCDGTPDIIAYPANRAGWGRLCRILSVGNNRAKKGDCILTRQDAIADTDGLLLIIMPGLRPDTHDKNLHPVIEAAPGRTWLAADMPRRGNDRRRLATLQHAASTLRIPLLAMNDVLYAAPEQRDLQDVMTCIREGTTIEAAGRRLEINAERHLKIPQEMARLFRDCPDAIAQTQILLNRITFDLKDLKYEYPDEPIPPGWEPQAWLEDLTWRSAQTRYPQGVPDKVTKLIRKELALIAHRDYARYFLTIHDIVHYANSRNILCQGRGSAANSAVCFVLGITAVDPNDSEPLFERFISMERTEPPDIDVDFEHERREEVIQFIYKKYGRHRAALAATVISYRPRSAIRDVGKAMGLTEDVTARIAGMQWGSWGTDISHDHVRAVGLDPNNPMLARTIGLAGRLIGFPRHLSQHVGGFILSRGRLDETVPIGNAAMPERTFIEWDKDDIDALRLMKVDVLALGMLTCIRKALDLMRQHAEVDYGLADVPGNQTDVYDMLCKGDSLGVFQVESRAQMNMLPRLKPKKFYDLVIQVAIVRPGPIQGDMVHPYLRRRAGLEKVTYPSPSPKHGKKNELYLVLNRTKGVPLFQEQAMKLAMVAARFTPDEANGLRRAMATFRNVGTIGQFEKKMVDRMVARGYEADFARRCFDQIKGFGSYGFPESHAASFAKLVYISSFIKCRYPAVFACALLNAQPMGFYAPAQIVRDAQEHGVEVRPVDVNHSKWDNTLEGGREEPLALRIGMRQIDGLSKNDIERLVAARTRPFATIEEMSARASLYGRPLRLLADADAFRSMELDRRDALWDVRRLPDSASLPLFAAADARELADEPDARLPPMPLAEHISADYQTVRLSLKGHPMHILRPVFQQEGIASCAQTAKHRDGGWIRTAGVVLVRQRPGKGNAIFLTLEDETGVTNVVLWARLFEKFRKEVMGARLLVIEGRVQRSPEGVIHLMAQSVVDRTSELRRLSDEHETRITLSRADEFLHPQAPRSKHPRDVRILPKSRDFH